MDLNIYTKSLYRYDIQGVRALGAILIMTYHIWFGKVSGGVDIFFVISGYFMAGMLIRSHLKYNKIKPFDFWSRIIRRVAPLAYTVIAATVALGYFFMPPHLWGGSIIESLTSALHIENLQLIRVGTDYLASNDPPSPFQQFWALSIQIQFYFFLPFIFMLGLALSHKFNSYKALLSLIISIILISFCFSIYYTNLNPPAAYFNTATRAWQFFVGVAVFLALPFINISQRFSKILIWFGFLLIFAIGIFVPQNFSYPGYISLLPVMAASCIIVAGSFYQKGYLHKLLSSKVFVYIGNLSFSIYLWHWPFLIYFQHYTGKRVGDISVIEGLAIIVLALIVAVFSKKLIENPFASIKKTSIFFPYVVGIVFFVPVIALSLYIQSKITNLYNQVQTTNYDVKNYYKGNHAYVQNESLNISLEKLISAPKDRSISSLVGCSDGVIDGEISFCELGDKNSDTSILLVGGSRLAHWEPLFSYWAKQENIKIIAATIHSCSFGVNILQDQNCQEWNNKVINFISEINPRPKIVVINSSRSEHKDTVQKLRIDNGEYIPLGYVENIKKVLSIGIPVIGIRINPVFDDPNTCLWKNAKNPSTQCAIKYQQSLLKDNPALALKGKGFENFYPVDFTNVVCSDGLCPLVFDKHLTMADDSHYTASYISYLAPALLQSLDQQVNGLSNLLKN